MKIKEILKKSKFIVKTHQMVLKWYACALTLISPTWNSKMHFQVAFGRPLDLDNPQTFCEKIMKMKLEIYENDPMVVQCADKYAVRRYVEEKGCAEILVPLLAVYDHPSEIEWDALPAAFAMKWNYGCGFNIICSDKSKLDRDDTLRTMKKWGRSNYYLHYSEMQYKNIQKRIIVEQYLKPKQGKLPEDYKAYCFGGKTVCVMLCIGREYGVPKKLYFDRDFRFLRDYNYDGMTMPEDFFMEKPDGYDDLVRYADILSEPFPFVRVDFYLLDGKVYFGEITFTPAGALGPSITPEIDKKFGEMIQLPEL